MNEKLKEQIERALKDTKTTWLLLKFWQDHPLPELPEGVEASWFSTIALRTWGTREPKRPLLKLTYTGPARDEEDARQTLIDVQYSLRCLFGHATPSRSSYEDWELNYAKRQGGELSTYEGIGNLDGYKIKVSLSVPWFGTGCTLSESTKETSTQVFIPSCTGG
jgi:hypothetical protein